MNPQVKTQSFNKVFTVAPLPKLSDDQRREYTANCKICTLASAMRDCPACKFSAAGVYPVNIVNQLMTRPHKTDEQPAEYRALVFEVRREPTPIEQAMILSDFSDLHECAERVEAAIQRVKQIPNTEFGSQAWFAGIDEIPF